MNGSTTKILDPTGMRQSMGLQLAPRPEDLKGLTVGLVDNGRWATWGMVSQHYEELLKERYGVGEVIYLNQEKEELQNGTGRQQMHEDLASKCDAVIVGLGN